MLKHLRKLLAGTVAISLCLLSSCASQAKMYTASTFAMDTMISQQAYGENATAAMQEVNIALADFDAQMSLYNPDSDISAINHSAGIAPASVSPQTVSLLEDTLALSQQSEGAFAVTIAPLSLLWGVTSDSPKVPNEAEIDALLPLVDDTAVDVYDTSAYLSQPGMALDLGGVAKGAACDIVKEIYTKNSIDSALVSIGGNVYAHGTKPDGTAFRVGFRDPNRSDDSYIAAVEMTNEVLAISGGYERFFEIDGKRYIHILDPQTGYPVENDIISVGVISEIGTEADFWSTALFVAGSEKTINYMQNGGKAILLDSYGTLYVSASLKDKFEMSTSEYTVEFVEEVL